MFTILTGNEAVVFDPCEDGTLLDLLEGKGIKKVYILLTHEHYDHTSGLKWLKDHFCNTLYCHQSTADRLATKRGSLPHLVSFVLAQQDKEDGGHRYKDFKKNYQPYSCLADKTFVTKDSFLIGGLFFEVTSTPGHSPGSACYILNNKILFSGDTLLQNDAVITRFPESNKEQYLGIALPYLQSLDKNIIVLPGHGDPFVLSETNNI